MRHQGSSTCSGEVLKSLGVSLGRKYTYYWSAFGFFYQARRAKTAAGARLEDNDDTRRVGLKHYALKNLG